MNMINLSIIVEPRISLAIRLFRPYAKLAKRNQCEEANRVFTRWSKHRSTPPPGSNVGLGLGS